MKKLKPREIINIAGNHADSVTKALRLRFEDSGLLPLSEEQEGLVFGAILVGALGLVGIVEKSRQEVSFSRIGTMVEDDFRREMERLFR